MINSSTDIRSLAAQFVQVDRAGQDQIFAARRAGFEATLKLYSSLTSKISDFQKQLSSLSASLQFEAFSVTQSAEGYANISASSGAAAGSYKIHVNQLATAHQVALSFASETELMPTNGTITLGVGGASFDINLADLGAGADLTTLRDTINADAANPGVQASIVRSDGAVKLLLTSKETGAVNTLTMATDGTADTASLQAAMDGHSQLSAAADAKILLGDTQALELTSATNEFANVIDGVTVKLLKTHQTGETLTFTVGQDAAATQERLQQLADSYNAIVDVAKQSSAKNDGTVRLLLQQLRTELGGSGISVAGLELDRSGKLAVNGTRMQSYLENNPEGLTQLMSGTGGLLERLSDRLDTFSKGEGALLTRSTESVRANLDQLESRLERFDRRMELALNRYIAQFSQMQSLISSMEQTHTLF